MNTNQRTDVVDDDDGDGDGDTEDDGAVNMDVIVDDDDGDSTDAGDLKSGTASNIANNTSL